MDAEGFSRLERSLVGRFGSIKRRDFDWALHLAGGGVISLSVPWRIVRNGRIAFADRDHDQQFGLPAPIDGEVLCNVMLAGKAIVSVAVDPETADLSIEFAGAVRLDAFNYSAGYEGWEANLPSGEGSLLVVARGGGGVAIFT